MPRSFNDVVEGWVFCGYDILLYKWERGRVLAGDTQELNKLQRIEDRMRGEMRKAMYRKAEDKGQSLNADEVDGMITQTNGNHYASPIYGRRFQVMESWIGGNYYIADHTREDLIHRERGPGSNTKMFPTRDAAEEYIRGFTSLTECDTEGNSSTADGTSLDGGLNGDSTMAKLPAKAPVTAEKLKITKTEKPAKVAAAPKAAKPAAAPKVESERKGRGLSTSGTVASVTRDLILAGKLGDAAIIEKVKAQFPDAKVAKNLVTHYRGTLVAKGVEVPAAKA